ncbi:MAG: helix-hairpin-helix domain-containing protein [Bacteroidota bacterium]
MIKNNGMINKLLREFFLLTRGEQRAMILVSLLLVLSLGARITVQMVPAREPPELEQFLEESRRIMAELAEADSIKIHDLPRPNHTYPLHRTQRENPAIIQINSADSADLLPLPGIGPVFAGRIIKYRNMLGGFVNTDQLREVYGLSGETILQVIPHIHIDTSGVRKLHINNASFSDLLKHPYLEYENVKALVKFRDAEDSIRSFKEIWENHLLPDSILLKIRPYLDYCH